MPSMRKILQILQIQRSACGTCSCPFVGGVVVGTRAYVKVRGADIWRGLASGKPVQEAQIKIVSDARREWVTFWENIL